MQRNILVFLNNWHSSQERKPLILRGARQVGKTWVVRELARQKNLQLIELNFEDDPSLEKLFESNDPKQIIQLIEFQHNSPIQINQSILFLDELQAKPHLIPKLRWFAEKMPQLAVIGAGSLLEFALENHTFSMPVGRVGFAHLEPLSFEEFLGAIGHHPALDFIHTWKLGDTVPEPIHQKLSDLFKQYTLVGGMPAAVQSWISQPSFLTISQIHHDLLASYRTDFSKYAGKLSTQRLEEIITSVPRFLGQKFVYSEVNRDIHSAAIKQALELINLAKVCHRVECTAANGVPLGAEVRSKYFKQIFLDVGLACSMLKLDLSNIKTVQDLMLVNRGAIAEQAAGQLLRTLEPFFVEPSLYYWERTDGKGSAELDYIVQQGPSIIPIEVKSGATGTLKSLNLFMKSRGLHTAVRIYAGHPRQDVVDYQLISIPFYLVGQLKRLLQDITNASSG